MMTTILTIAIVSIGVLVLVFLLALCKAAGKPMPKPERKL